MIGIVDWLVAEVDRLGVTQRLNVFADEDDVLSENPDVVIVATGGLPDENNPVGNVQALSTWDVLGNPEAVPGSALIFDSLGRAQAASCADQLAAKGVQVEIITPDAMAGLEIGKIERPAFMQRLYEKGVKFTTDYRLTGAEKSGSGITAQFTNVFSDDVIERKADHLIVETGLVPNDDLFVGLKDGSVNKGATEIASALSGKPQPAYDDQQGYQLYVVGDAVSCRDIHTAILDSMRICAAL
jgi:pyruvate/2-oxoglutarate dehydrogenase complex dihydrolipoamide dehydrogenase (E3) component